MRKRPQFFEDLDRELRGEPEATPGSAEVRVESITRHYRNVKAADDVYLVHAVYARAMRERFQPSQAAIAAMIPAQQQYLQSPNLTTSIASSSVTLWPSR